MGRSVALFLMALLLAGCTAEGDEDIRGLEGTLVLEGDTYWIIADSADARFLPERVPASYREDGLRVLVSGRSRPAETPADPPFRHLEITSLAALDD